MWFILNLGWVFVRYGFLIDWDWEWLKFLCIESVRFCIIFSVLNFYVGMLFKKMLGGVILLERYLFGLLSKVFDILIIVVVNV